MAARAPTSFSDSQPDILPRKQILASVADDMFDDQQLVYDKRELVISDMFVPLVDANVASWNTVATYNVKAPDKNQPTIDCQCALLVRSDDATDFQVGILRGGMTPVRFSTTITASHTSFTWCPWFTVTIFADGTYQDLSIQMNNHLSPATPRLDCAGIGLFTNA